VTDWTDDLALAHRLVDAADAATLARFRAADLVVETKPDLTPVSDADRSVEAALRASLAGERPGDAVVGEEYGETAGSSGSRRWIVDPIDGTKNFVRGMPVWATLLGLQVEGATVVGVVSAPALGRRWWAARGDGAWTGSSLRDATECRVSAVSSVDDAFLSYSSLSGWDATGRGDGFRALTEQVWRTRAFGDFWSHMLVAEGAVDISCEPEVSLWDLAALQPIVEEAGGRFTDLSGVAGPDGGSVLCTNGLLHNDVLRLLAAS
jgi:histidinol-phosphatase